MVDLDSAVPPPPHVRLRDVAVGDAAALARILIAANDSAFRGLVPPRCLAFTEVESTSNWRKTLTAGLPPGDFLLVAESPLGVPIGYAWGGPSRTTRSTAASCARSVSGPQTSAAGLAASWWEGWQAASPIGASPA